MDNSKIAILSTVINKELYQISSPLFPEKIQKYIIDGTNGMHGISSIFYMMEKLKGKGIEWRGKSAFVFYGKGRDGC